MGDVKIIFLTVWKAFVKEEGINADGQVTIQEFAGNLKSKEGNVNG